jgi:stress-induced morphogen
MAISSQEIECLIKTALADAIIKIEDLAGDGDHYAIHVISQEFAGKSRIQQHQMIYSALQGKVGGQLHALSVRTSLPGHS